MSKSRYMPLYKNNLQVGWAKNLTDVVEQIVCSQVKYVEKKNGGYNIKTYDCAPNENEESVKRRRDEIRNSAERATTRPRFSRTFFIVPTAKTRCTYAA